MRGEAGMSDKIMDSDSMQYATLENVYKCIDNAFRLYDDASKVSTPTKAALLELGIEELVKGLLITFKTPEFHKLAMSQPLDNDKNFMLSSQQFKISDFKVHDHKKRLEMIQFILDGIKELYNNDKGYLDPLLDRVTQNYRKFSPVPVGDSKKALDTEISLLSYMDIKKLYKIKEHGFYVDFDNGKVIEPKNVEFQLEGIRRVFNIVYGALNNLINLFNGFSLSSSKSDIKKALGKLYDRMSKEDQEFLEKKEDD